MPLLQQRLAQVSAPSAAQRQDQQYDIQILISASMPDASLRALFAQAAAYGPEKVRFVLRGFKPKKLGQTIAYFRRYFPDPVEDYVIIEVDPPLFRALGVRSVPAFLVKDEQGRWWEARGDMSLQQAIEHVRKPLAPLVAGPLYPVEEPDLMELLRVEAARVDWNAYQQQMVRAAESGIFDSGVRLPLATRSIRRQHTPAVPLLEDVVVEQDSGPPVVLAKAGQTINPLEYTTLSRPIIVIDAGQPKQIQWAREQVSEESCHHDIFWIGRASLYELRSLFQGCGVWPLWKPFADGFGVSSTPALLRQEGHSLIIQEFDLARWRPRTMRRSTQ